MPCKTSFAPTHLSPSSTPTNPCVPNSKLPTWISRLIFIAHGLFGPSYFLPCRFEACASGELAVAKWLFSQGCSGQIFDDDKYGNTPFLMACCEAGSIAVASWILRRQVERDGDVRGMENHATRPNNFGSTPLLMTCQRGHLETARWLMHRANAGADSMRPNKSGWTPLLISAHKGHLPIVRWLVTRDPAFARKGLFARNNVGVGPVLATVRALYILNTTVVYH